MKKFFTSVLIFVLPLFNAAQNLVLNPSFEDYTSCPTWPSMIDSVIDWTNSANSPDYFNICASGTYVHVPSNICGYQQPASGVAYAGILAYGSFSPNLLVDIREYISGRLTQPLTIGARYYVSFKVVRMNFSSHAVDHLGVKFLTGPFSPLLISNSAHFVTSTVIKDTLDWSLIQGSFIADSNYQYICIGNHFSDTNTTVVSMQPVTMGYNAYYFIDDVCVAKDSAACYLTSDIDESKDASTISIFPNPFTDHLNVETGDNENSEIFIYDIMSKELLHKRFINSITLNTESFSKGIYIFEIRSRKNIQTGKLFK